MGEFYSEFGSFDVSITLPENYYVAATGNLQNPDEQEKIREAVDQTNQLQEFDKENDSFPASAEKFKTVRFIEENIHDFAWFADKRFYILRGEVKLPHSGRTVNTWAYFTNKKAGLWKNSIDYINDAIYYYSLWYGDYPYDNCTAVNAPLSAGGGMEYPTITVISGASTAIALEMVIMHEVGHNWFYGILASNERDYPWMDEGINTFSEMRYFDAKYPDNKLYKMAFEQLHMAKLLGIDEFNYRHYHELLYLVNARRNLDQPINLASDEYAMINYGGIVYSKTGLGFYYLKEYIGESKFNDIMQDYFESWKFRHPYPEDLEQIFKTHTDKDLSWFFKDLLNTTKKLDYKILREKNGKVLLKNSGQIKAPVMISNDDKSLKWVEGFEGKQWIDLELGESDQQLQLYKPSLVPEINQKNNYLKTKGLFKRTEPLEIRLVGLLEKYDRTTINVLPSAGWNFHNGFMLGGLLYSDVIPLPKFEYQVMPMYSFGPGDLAGSAALRYHVFPYSNLFQRITLAVTGRQFAYANEGGSYYQKITGNVNFRFVRKHLENPVDNDIRFIVVSASDIEKLVVERQNKLNAIFGLEYEHNNRVKKHPYNLVLNVHGNDNFIKGSAEARYKHVYIYKNSLDIRFFGGVFLHKSEDLSSVYNFTVSGTTGVNDYVFDELFLARFEDPASSLYVTNQFARENGGFSVYSPFGQTNDYLLALNVSSSLPVAKNIPIQFYVNAAAFGNSVNVPDWESSESYLYEGGIKIQLVRDVFEFYFPLVMSKDLKDYAESSTDNYFQNIRFTLNLNRINPFHLARDLNL